MLLILAMCTVILASRSMQYMRHTARASVLLWAGEAGHHESSLRHARRVNKRRVSMLRDGRLFADLAAVDSGKATHEELDIDADAKLGALQRSDSLNARGFT